MWISILAIAVTLINIWLVTLFLTSVTNTWRHSPDKTRKSFTSPQQGVSLWSFILLLFTGSSPKPPSPDLSR
ncbi:hypothetical protein AVDCRST_MAG81-501 [uncultured Synechococcales cyanobacterium]|uniref:Uncharacterized protein n=1 Tax=uncultured Synechococcales cyanobacterium TaxID=1936017 RepID=A0A6J4UR81_9CYAN|nr:hypothetical protein AVDCRST_MAG81-501 [uncultured Synechococcales cyanobacterium]